MSSVKKFVALEFDTVKPYMTIKNLAIYMFIGIVMSISTNNPMAFGSMFCYIGVMLITYLFAVGDQNGIDTLYSTLPICRKDVVAGRYMFTTIMFAVLFIISVVMSIIVNMVFSMSFTFSEIAISIAVITLIFSINSLIQIPVFFRLGYIKGKIVSYLPMVVIFGLVFLLANPFFSWIKAMPKLTTMIVFAVLYILVFIVSYKLSKKFYERRDF